MHTPNPERAGLRRRSTALALAVLLAAALPLPVLAQEAEESPGTVPAEPVAGIAFPVEVGGQILTAETFSGPEWLAQFSGEDGDPAFVSGTEELLASVGRTVDDLTVKSALFETAPGQPAVIAALRIDETDAREWVAAAVDLLVGDVVEPGLVLRPFTTKWTLRVTDATMPGVYPRTVYLKDDTAWFIQADEEYVWEVLDQLPEPAPVGASSADSLLTDVPVTIGGERRIGLYESTEPLFLPSLGERLEGGIDEWLVDLYLEARTSPAQIIGVIAWWGLEGGQDGIQIEGYRLPEGGEELSARLLDEVFLVSRAEQAIDPELLENEVLVDPLTEILEGSSYTEEEIAGRTVAVFDFGPAKQYILGSADTVWVITDPLGEPEKVEEAVAALS